MEIVYDETNNVRFRLDDGREFKLVDLLADLERLEKIDGAMSLVANSREWNRKRVLELEDELERYHRAHVCTSSCEKNSHVAFTGKTMVKDLEELVQEERIRGNNLAQRLAQSEQRERELEAQNQRLTEYANAQEARHAELAAATTRVRAAQDRLLAAATTRVREATEILSRPVVVGARNDIVTTKGARLADAITNALRCLNA